MRIADRIILAFYTLMMAAVSVLLVVFVIGLFPLELVTEYLRLVPGSWEFAVGGILFFIVSIKLLIAGVSRGGPKEITVHIGDDGVVRVSLAAVEKFISKTASQVRGVHNVKVKVFTNGDLLKVQIVAGVLPEANIPDISKLVQSRVKDGVKETVGREVSEVQILFTTISYEEKSKQRLD